MKRREFLGVLGFAAAWPLSAGAQQQALPVIGMLNSGSPGLFAVALGAFRQGLEESGYVEGRDIVVDYRWAEGHYDRLPAEAAQLVGRHVRVIVAISNVSAQAAKAATTTVPIVFLVGSNPVEGGLVASLNRPGGNATGINMFAAELTAKRLGLLLEMRPDVRIIVGLANPSRPNITMQLRDLSDAASTVSRQVQIVNASNEREIDLAFSKMAEMGAEALLVGNDPFFSSQREKVLDLAARQKLPAIYEWREAVTAGGLMSYGTSLAEAHRQAGAYTAQILKGARPADLPVLQPTKFELVINLKTARALGITVPATLLARADEVIE